jgi:16S rRNA (uracil1498-N3)-methyltransferase
MFVPGASPDSEIELPKAEIDKLRKVLRLGPGAQIAVLPNDGSLIHAEFTGYSAVPIAQFHPNTESRLSVTLAQALPKGEKLDDIVRAGTELGVSHFLLFPSDRTVVKWDAAKLADRLRRLEAIAIEAAEVSYRVKVPHFSTAENLQSVLAAHPDADVLSEAEGLPQRLARSRIGNRLIVIGPEGGWSPRERDWIGDLAVTIGPRVLRVEHAAIAACSLLLCDIS